MLHIYLHLKLHFTPSAQRGGDEENDEGEIQAR